jgi:hypothetical protein
MPYLFLQIYLFLKTPLKKFPQNNSPYTLKNQNPRTNKKTRQRGKKEPFSIIASLFYKYFTQSHFHHTQSQFKCAQSYYQPEFDIKKELKKLHVWYIIVIFVVDIQQINKIFHEHTTNKISRKFLYNR